MSEDSKAEAGSGNEDSISAGDSSDGNISVNIGGGNVTINNNQYSTKKKKKRNAQERNDKTDMILSEIYTSLFTEDNGLKTEQIRITKQALMPYNESSVWQMCRIEKNSADKKDTRCSFFDPNEQRRNVYERRTLDCRLFPFVIKHIITSDVACERLKNAEFKRITDFKEFVF